MARDWKVRYDLEVVHRQDVERDLAALRTAVARLMATGTRQPWWADWCDADGSVSCGYCAAPWSDCAEDVTHDPDCPALAVEAAYREGGEG